MNTSFKKKKKKKKFFFFQQNQLNHKILGCRCTRSTRSSMMMTLSLYHSPVINSIKQNLLKKKNPT